MQDLGTLPGFTDSIALGVSGDGLTVVGRSYARAFRWNARLGLHSLLNIQGLNGSADACSADGRVVVGKAEGNLPTAFRWEAGFVFDLFHLAGDLESHATDVSSDGATVVGNSINGPHSTVFIWTAASDIVPIAPGLDTRAFAVSADGTVVVGSVRQQGQTIDRAFRWTASGFEILEVAATRYYATDTNADGSVVVGVFDEPALAGGFVWTATRGARPLATLLPSELIAGWRDLEPIGISSDGRVVVGHGENPCGEQEAWRATIDLEATSPAHCRADFDGSGALDPDDLADFITCFFSAPPCPRAEFDRVCGVNPDDLGDFITAFFTGCP